jgi:hypothetical protein
MELRKKVSSTLQFISFWRRNFLYGKKESCLQDSPPAAGRGSGMFPLRRSAIITFLPYGKFGEFSYIVKKRKCLFPSIPAILKPCIQHITNICKSQKMYKKN